MVTNCLTKQVLKCTFCNNVIFYCEEFYVVMLYFIEECNAVKLYFIKGCYSVMLYLLKDAVMLYFFKDVSNTMNTFDVIASLHTGVAIPVGHDGPGFFSWHKAFLRMYDSLAYIYFYLCVILSCNQPTIIIKITRTQIHYSFICT